MHSQHCAITTSLWFQIFQKNTLYPLRNHSPLPFLSILWKPLVDFLSVWICVFRFSLVQFSCSVMFDSLRPHGLQHTRPPCPSPTPGVYSNSCPLSQWCHPIISFSVVPLMWGNSSWPPPLGHEVLPASAPGLAHDWLFRGIFLNFYV